MKRIILLVLIAAILLIGVSAMAEMLLYEISLSDNQYFVNRGGIAYISGPDITGKYRVEGRVLLQNTKKYCLRYQEPTLYIYQNGKYAAELPAVMVAPDSTPPKGFTLLKFSGADVELNGYEGIKLSIISNVQRTEEKEAYLGWRSGRLEQYEFSDGLRMCVDISDLDDGVYSVNLIAFDENGQLAWAEDTHANREYFEEVNWGIEDYEIKLLRENGKEPVAVYGAVYRNKQK